MKTIRRFTISLLLAASLSFALPCSLSQTGTVATPSPVAPTLYRVANENDFVTSTAAVSYSFGVTTGTTNAGVACSATTLNCMSPVVASTGPLSNFAAVNGTAAKTDPAPGLPKGFYIVETAAAQTGSTKASGTGVVTAWTTPALPTPPPVAPTVPALTLTVTGATITTPIVLQLGGTLGWCTFISANTNANYGIALSGCLTPPPGK